MWLGLARRSVVWWCLWDPSVAGGWWRSGVRAVKPVESLDTRPEWCSACRPSRTAPTGPSAAKTAPRSVPRPGEPVTTRCALLSGGRGRGLRWGMGWLSNIAPDTRIFFFCIRAFIFFSGKTKIVTKSLQKLRKMWWCRCFLMNLFCEQTSVVQGQTVKHWLFGQNEQFVSFELHFSFRCILG